MPTRESGIRCLKTLPQLRAITRQRTAAEPIYQTPSTSCWTQSASSRACTWVVSRWRISGAWLHGYDYAKLESRVARSAEEEDFDAFGDFLCDKYDGHDVGGWAATIAYYHGDDASAFDEFFKLLDEFRASRKQRTEEKT